MSRILRSITLSCALALPLGACSMWEYMFGPGEFTEIEAARPEAAEQARPAQPDAKPAGSHLPTPWASGQIAR